MWKLKGEAPYPVEITSVEELQKNGYFMPWNTLTDQEKKMKKAYDDVMKKDLGPEHKKWEEDFKKIDEELVKVKEKKRNWSREEGTPEEEKAKKDAEIAAIEKAKKEPGNDKVGAFGGERRWKLRPEFKEIPMDFEAMSY